MGDCIKDICDVKETLITNFKTYMSGGFEQICTKEAGEVADIIKDLAEAEYYCTVTKAMLEGQEDRYGYSRGNWNMHSNGRMGYKPQTYGDTPDWSMDRMGYKPYIYDEEPTWNMSRMGYRPFVDQEPYVKEYISERGRGYDDYKEAKRHYTETHSPSDKEKMNESTATHVNNAIAGIKEMWQDADMSLRKDIKEDLEALLKTM